MLTINDIAIAFESKARSLPPPDVRCSSCRHFRQWHDRPEFGSCKAIGMATEANGTCENHKR